MWLWISFQMSRLETRLWSLSEDDITDITESSDVIYARLTDRQMELKDSLDRYIAVRDELGLPPDERLVIQ